MVGKAVGPRHIEVEAAEGHKCREPGVQQVQGEGRNPACPHHPHSAGIGPGQPPGRQPLDDGRPQRRDQPAFHDRQRQPGFGIIQHDHGVGPRQAAAWILMRTANPLDALDVKAATQVGGKTDKAIGNMGPLGPLQKAARRGGKITGGMNPEHLFEGSRCQLEICRPAGQQVALRQQERHAVLSGESSANSCGTSIPRTDNHSLSNCVSLYRLPWSGSTATRLSSGP